MRIITVGIDLAKNVFAVHGVDENGRAALVKPKVRREGLADLIAKLPPAGSVRVPTVTEKRFASMKLLVGLPLFQEKTVNTQQILLLRG